ncbi:MAG: hypothetical protein [Arizlama microvirus]|nr:MAG: hypothetical protein [Arizlama microvirus]
MAKGKSGRSQTRPGQFTSRTRDVPTIASLLSFEPDLKRSVRDVSRADRRQWDPDPLRPIRTSSGKIARTTHKPPAKLARASRKPVAFSVPSYQTLVPHRGQERPLHVPECQRREQRRQVIFAKGHSGGGHAKPKWGPLSRTRCK